MDEEQGGLRLQVRGDVPGTGQTSIDYEWPSIATSDPERAARWWRPLGPDEERIDWRPMANVAALMGERNFLYDVDTDSGKIGKVSLAKLVEQGGGEEIPPTFCYQSGGGGLGYLLAVPAGIEVRSSTGKIAEDNDIKGIRSYCILPPSRSGKGEYLLLGDRSPDVQSPGWMERWLREQHRLRTEKATATPRPLGGDPRPLPSHLTRRAQAYVAGALSRATAAVARAERGKRNQELNDEAWGLFSRFAPAGLLDTEDIAEAMRDAAASCGLYGSEVERTIASAINGGDRKNRSHAAQLLVRGADPGPGRGPDPARHRISLLRS